MLTNKGGNPAPSIPQAPLDLAMTLLLTFPDGQMDGEGSELLPYFGGRWECKKGGCGDASTTPPPTIPAPGKSWSAPKAAHGEGQTSTFPLPPHGVVPWDGGDRHGLKVLTRTVPFLG